uniref:Uncharacterized protein n=1 Tax=Entomoneis paludosa TaxID=265537 RepID=A0A7S2Y997_9STRA|mmetsp:Transcript_23188/g.48256  ORF Transcript_23188/g.48256 Transcript_23188/m.48256 type:complete len:708 (+) Transcript_23188:217-2340(+)
MSSFDVFDPNKGRIMVDEVIATLNNIGSILHVPGGKDVLVAGQAAMEDAVQATQSTSYLLFLVGQPIARSMAWLIYWLALFIWKFIVVEGIYNHGLSQAKEIMVRYWAWQSSLTKEQLLIEACVFLAIAGLYRLHLFLKRHKYLHKFSVWFDVQKRQWTKAYYKAVKRIARTSIYLAAMTSHIIFTTCAAGVWFLFPGFVGLLAKPNFISLFSFWFPLLCTVTSLFEFEDEQRATQEYPQTEIEEKNINSSRRRTAGKEKKTKRRQTLVGRLRRGSTDNAHAPMIPSSEKSLKDELDDWKRFWMVRGSIEASKCLLAWVTPSWFTATLLNLEMFFYIWIYALPFIQPQSIAGQGLPEGRPLRVICSYLGPYSRRSAEAISGVIPVEFWQNKVVAFARQLLSALVLVRVVKQPTSDVLVHMLEEGRGLVIPFLTLMTPGFLTRYGVVYVQHFLSIAKSSNGETTLWLRYWVLHALVDGTLYHFSSILWWIPFSTHAIFVLWCYLSLPRTITHWYDVVETEFKHFGLLPGEHDGTFEQTKTARFLGWVWDILPKAADAEEEKADPPSEEVPIDQTTGDNGNVNSEENDQVSEMLDSPFKDRAIVAADTNTTADIDEDDDDDSYNPSADGLDTPSSPESETIAAKENKSSVGASDNKENNSKKKKKKTADDEVERPMTRARRRTTAVSEKAKRSSPIVVNPERRRTSTRK